MVLASSSKREPTVPLEALYEVCDGQLRETQSLIRSDQVMIQNREFDNILVLGVGVHVEGFVPLRAEGFLLLVSLVDFLIPVVFMTDLDQAGRERNKTKPSELRV